MLLTRARDMYKIVGISYSELSKVHAGPPASEGIVKKDIIGQVESMASCGVPTHEIIKLLASEVQRLTNIVEGGH
jgi:hypothetical protein